MLNAYFHIAPPREGGGPVSTLRQPRSAAAAEEPKPEAKRPSGKPGKPKKAAKPKPPAVPEPFDMREGGSVHARFRAPEPRADPVGSMSAYTAYGASVDGAGGDAPEDPYEDLLEEADAAGVADDEETDSCVTFEETDSCVTFEDDHLSDTSEVLGTSPRAEEPAFPPPPVCLVKRRGRASEAGVYSGPELWYEPDDFIQ